MPKRTIFLAASPQFFGEPAETIGETVVSEHEKTNRYDLYLFFLGY